MRVATWLSVLLLLAGCSSGAESDSAEGADLVESSTTIPIADAYVECAKSMRDELVSGWVGLDPVPVVTARHMVAIDSDSSGAVVIESGPLIGLGPDPVLADLDFDEVDGNSRAFAYTVALGIASAAGVPSSVRAEMAGIRPLDGVETFRDDTDGLDLSWRYEGDDIGDKYRFTIDPGTVSLPAGADCTAGAAVEAVRASS